MRGGREWEERATSSFAADDGGTYAASSASERAERAESGVGKKSKTQYKYLNVTSDDLWRIRDKLDGKKSSLGRTYKMNTEANNKVYDLSQQAMKYLETLALLYANFEQICTEKREVEEQFDGDFDDSLRKLSESRARCVKVAATYARIEEDLNEGLRVVRSQFHDTAEATMSLSCGKNDRDNNEVLYLQETLALVDSLLARETHDDGFEVVVTERGRSLGVVRGEFVCLVMSRRLS